jgi:hypothetical protein
VSQRATILRQKIFNRLSRVRLPSKTIFLARHVLPPSEEN